MQPLIFSHTGEFRTPEHRAFPLGDLNPLHATPNTHGVLPREPVIGEQPFPIKLAVNTAISGPWKSPSLLTPTKN
jgi:hypothetical protein